MHGYALCRMQSKGKFCHFRLTSKSLNVFSFTYICKWITSEYMAKFGDERPGVLPDQVARKETSAAK